MNVRELIEQLNTAAARLPQGLESPVRVHVCNGWETAGVLTKEVAVAVGEDDDEVEDSVLVQAHPHADDQNTVRKPVTMGVDNELERLVDGDRFPRPGITVAFGDTGEGVQLPYGPDGRPMLPGSPDAVAAGCICDPEKNAHGAGVRSEDDRIALVTKDGCEVHRRVPVNPHDISGEDA